MGTCVSCATEAQIAGTVIAFALGIYAAYMTQIKIVGSDPTAQLASLELHCDQLQRREISNCTDKAENAEALYGWGHDRPEGGWVSRV